VGRFARLGWHSAEQLPDFTPWLQGFYSGEFYPYVIKFLRQSSSLVVKVQEDKKGDLTILRILSEWILSRLPQPMQMSFAIGLFNTHFQNLSPVASQGLAYQTNGLVAWEDFKYLVYAAISLSASEQDFAGEMANVWKAVKASIRGSPHQVKSTVLGESTILETLSKMNIKL
jgi:hypothetical protein